MVDIRTEQEKKWCEEIHNDRLESSKTFKKTSMGGFGKSVVEKYSDQAHFIYELLQNADDVGATIVKFVLEKDRLIFIHNGKRKFSISNPESKAEAEDEKKGTKGDINAITSVGASSKTESQIGKFGVGFKAVFQYTKTPYIYEDKFKFKIFDLFVPEFLEKDFDGRKSEETAFEFPFNFEEFLEDGTKNKKYKSPENSYKEILQKLKTLKNPLLFLRNLLRIEFEVCGESGSYSKNIIKEVTFKEKVGELEESNENIIENYNFGKTTAELLELKQKYGDKNENKRLWLFSRNEKGYKYSVGFYIDEKNDLISVRESAYCFFPTKVDTKLNFIINAPFLLTDSREGIKAGNEHNKHMIDLLAELSADSLEYLKEIGESELKEENANEDNSKENSDVEDKKEKGKAGGKKKKSRYTKIYK